MAHAMTQDTTNAVFIAGERDLATQGTGCGSFWERDDGDERKGEHDQAIHRCHPDVGRNSAGLARVARPANTAVVLFPRRSTGQVCSLLSALKIFNAGGY